MAAMKLGDTWRNRDPVRMRPDVLKMADGTVWFPIFSQIEQAPADYRKRFSVVTAELGEDELEKTGSLPAHPHQVPP